MFEFFLLYIWHTFYRHFEYLEIVVLGFIIADFGVILKVYVNVKLCYVFYVQFSLNDSLTQTYLT